MTQKGYTHIEIPKSDLALFNQLKAEEAARREQEAEKSGKPAKRFDSEEFFLYLLHLYMRTREDDQVRTYIKVQMERFNSHPLKSHTETSSTESP